MEEPHFQTSGRTFRLPCHKPFETRTSKKRDSGYYFRRPLVVDSVGICRAQSRWYFGAAIG